MGLFVGLFGKFCEVPCFVNIILMMFKRALEVSNMYLRFEKIGGVIWDTA